MILGALAFDISSNDDILNSLSIGDMVIYRDERYKWGGITLDTVGPFANEPYCILTQDAKGKDGILTTKAFLKKINIALSLIMVNRRKLTDAG